MRNTTVFILLGLLTSIIMLSSCKSKKYSTIEEAEGRQLTFSYGGGFAGTYTIFTLLENGQLFKSHGKNENFIETTSVDKNITTQIFDNYDQLGFKESNIDNPGNMTFRITSSNGDDNHQVKWTEYGEGTELLQKYFDITMKQITPGGVNQTEKNFKIK